jgi:hypothetical protein
LLIFPVFNNVYADSKILNNIDPRLLSRFETEVEIPAGSDHYLKISPNDLSFVEKDIVHKANGFDEDTINAIVKSPTWIQRDLIRQLKSLNNINSYVELLLSSDKKYCDEIAFIISNSPLGDVASADVIKDNVYLLYEIDEYLKYADIVDYDDSSGNYYSTVKYHILENGYDTVYEYPKDIYYWYIVHPELQGENAQFVYDVFWREFLFNHNDLGYPLLKEKIKDIEYLWDLSSYSQPGNRDWNEWINQHPTAIEVVSYWVGKTVPNNAFGSRPNQPNIIAHEHNGWCGELQRLATAVQRMFLISCIGASNVGEDHVWREFYHEGWHQNDNWWTDGGGCVDTPYVYTDGWGKDMSAIYATNGDGSIYDVTTTYLHPEETVKVEFNVKDGYMNPYDGAMVSVLVKGIKDITWYKNKILDLINNIWTKIPDGLKIRILENIYERLIEIVEAIPDVVDGTTLTIWNYTDINGRCSFNLGKNDEYIFIIQQPNQNLPWPLAFKNKIRTMDTAENKTYNVVFSDFSRKPLRYKKGSNSNGEYEIEISFESLWYQYQKNPRSQANGKYTYNGDLEVFVLDEENFNKYSDGKTFEYIDFIKKSSASISISTNEELYVIFKNNALKSNVILTLISEIYGEIEKSNICLTSPMTNLFENPMFNIGDIINISGVCTSSSTISFYDKEYDINPGEFNIIIETVNIPIGDYLIEAETNDFTFNQLINIIDMTPPELIINEPNDLQIITSSDLTISGTSFDSSGINEVTVSIENNDFETAEGKENWSYIFDCTDLSSGIHQIDVKAFDINGLSTQTTINFVIKSSDNGLVINEVGHYPQNPSNKSNVYIYANITSNSVFPVKDVYLDFYSSDIDDGIDIPLKIMFDYSSNPQIPRHIEDSLFNVANNHVFGCDIGFLEINTYEYMIYAIDVAGNECYSDIFQFDVE